mmetsp:Transcript_22179/g.36752  ORF Transcript_22179/g.36752 Transcript_22179/m.36752 type:complete len:166 (+) Transcript_22179:128-625(+)
MAPAPIAPITTLYSSFFLIYFVVLSARTIRQRFKLRIRLGDGTYESLTEILKQGADERTTRSKYSPLIKCIRSHGNFAEYVPIFLVCMALLEASGQFPSWAQHILCCIFLFCRVIHVEFGLQIPGAMGLGRRMGMICTLTCLVVVAVLNAYYAFPYAIKSIKLAI